VIEAEAHVDRQRAKRFSLQLQSRSSATAYNPIAIMPVTNHEVQPELEPDYSGLMDKRAQSNSGCLQYAYDVTEEQATLDWLADALLTLVKNSGTV
jgi:hypothetical protein